MICLASTSQGKQPTELEEYLTSLFANADQNETGVLGVHELRDLLRSADFGLTRLQIHTILAEAEYDESGMADCNRRGAPTCRWPAVGRPPSLSLRASLC